MNRYGGPLQASRRSKRNAAARRHWRMQLESAYCNPSWRLFETLSNEIFVDRTRARALRRLIDKVFAQHHLKRTTAFEVSEFKPPCNLSLTASESRSSLPHWQDPLQNLGAAWCCASADETAACLAGRHSQADEAKAPHRNGHRRLVSRDAARSFTALRRSRFRASSLLEDHSWQNGISS